MTLRIKYIIVILITVSTLKSVGQELKYKSSGIFRDTIIDKGFVTTRVKAISLDSVTYSFQMNDSIIIEFTKADFIATLENKIKEYDVDWDKELLQIVLLQPDSNLNFNKLNYSKKNKSRATFIVATLIEMRKCYIINAFTNLPITRLRKIFFLETNNTGRRFYTDNKSLVLETWDGAY